MNIGEKIKKSLRNWLFPDTSYGPDIFSVTRDTNMASATPNVALTYSAVYSCVKVIAETIATLPLFLYEKSANDKIKALNHNLYTLLHDKPNEESTSVTFFESLIMHILLQGNAFVEIVRDNLYNVVSLNLLNVNKMRVLRDEGGKICYEYNSDGRIIKFGKEQILHIAGLGWNGIIGYSVITLMRRQLSCAIKQDEFCLDLFSNGVKKVPILTHPNKLSAEGKKNLKESFREGWHKGIIVLEEQMTVDSMTMSMLDAQFLESRRFSVEEIARIFRVPPHMIGDLSRSTNNNIENQSIGFVTNTIRPWCVRIEKALNNTLLSSNERKKYTAEFMIDGLLRGDALKRQQSNQIKLNNGVLTRNEWRKMENMNEVKDEYGDDYFCSQQIRPIKTVYETEEKETQKNKDLKNKDLTGKSNGENKDE